jgi:16S rRNA C967 or C1407 C5-methylase (RsmB/RsmF family)
MAKDFKQEISLDDFYSQKMGLRWAEIKTLLMLEEGKKEVLVERWNRFSQDPMPQEIYSSLNSKKAIERDSAQLLKSYIMDPASIWVAMALDVQEGDRVLDMCAAPGGKTLILAEKIGATGELIANEMSENRREKLKKVIQQYIPFERRQNVWVTGKDGGLFAKSHAESFDRILVDAPCSGERYLLNSAEELQKWTPRWSERLAQRQYALLTAALICLKEQGTCVYSTCALSPLENDEVIKKLLRKKGDAFEVVEMDLSSIHKDLQNAAERTEFGLRVWPDRGGMGPIYFSKFKRKG